MVQTIPIFDQPQHEDVKIWRYMDFAKLVSLIDSRCLYFARADKFNDPFEGSLPRTNVNTRYHLLDSVPSEFQAKVGDAIALSQEINKQWKRYIAINCWHMNEHESAAMWKLYLKSDEGIAVHCTYRKLRESIIDNEQVFLGLVKYIDYEEEQIDSSLLQAPFFYKRKSFEHEREVRAVVFKFPSSDQTGLDFSQETISHGLKIKVDLENLIERVYVAPGAPDWLAELIRSLIQRYGYHCEVMQSKLDEQPVF